MHEMTAKAEFEASAALRAEFIDLATYAAWRKATAEGKVKMLGQRAGTGEPAPAAKVYGIDYVPRGFAGDDLVEAAAKAEFEASAALRAEFIDLVTYAAWRKAKSEGRVKVFGNR